MRLRLGGTVVRIERIGVLTCILFSAVLLTLAVYIIATRLKVTSSHESVESVQPTPIDQLLQRIMNDRQFDDVGERSVQDSRSKKTKSNSSGSKSITPTYGRLFT